MKKQVKTLNNGINYISCEFLSFGDYDNSCAVERANVRHLKELYELKDSIDSFSMGDWERNNTYQFGKWLPIESNEKLVECYGGYGSIQLWVREDVWNELELDSMDDYCVLDDELVSTIEMEMENQAWDYYVKYDLIKTLPDELDDEDYENQECKCLNCNWEGIQKELIQDVIHNNVCPNCNNPYSMKFYPIEVKTLREFADELDNDKLFELYLNCKEKTNTYGEVESGGNWYIDIDRIKDCFRELIEEMYNNTNESNQEKGETK